MKVLLIGNSENLGGPPLHHAMDEIGSTLQGVRRVLFIPYAAVSLPFDEYEARVQKQLSRFGIEVDSLHRHRNHRKAVQEAEAIMVGGGNTFKLTKMIQQFEIVEAVRFRVLTGIPYVGWGAGAIVASPTICTTNDMPIAEPDNFSAFNLVRFQLNVRYQNLPPQGHSGESQDQRIEEFLVMDPYVYVVALRDGSMVRISNDDIQLLGPNPAKIFRHGMAPFEMKPGDDLDFLFE